MAFSAQEIQEGGVAVLDNFIRNKPIDQVQVERVLLNTLMENVQESAGAKQYIVEQLRDKYASNFQWFNGSQIVTYSRRQTIQQASYQWRSAHDGVAIDEDRLVQHGIQVTDDGPGGMASDAERQILTNLLEEQMEVLRNGFEEQFSYYLHLDGLSSGDAITGLDGLVTTTPTAGTVGGISRGTNIFWRNSAATSIDSTVLTGTFLTSMEVNWRACVRNGGKPNKIIMGSTFYDQFRDFMLKTYGRMDFGQVGFKRVQAGTEMITFHGVEMEWSPEFADLDATFGGSPTWEKRCYFLNMNHLKLRPMAGQAFVRRKPPRAYDRYEYYWGLTWRGALTMNRSHAHAVLAVA